MTPGGRCHTQGVGSLPESLVAHLDALATTHKLLVASDFDGTLAPIVNNPDAARGDDAALEALRTLAALPDTDVALISGRSLRDLSVLTGMPQGVRLIGSHGAEWHGDQPLHLTPEQLDLIDEARRRAEHVLRNANGASIEEKPAGFAVHVRNMVDRIHAGEVLQRITEVLADLSALRLMHGKEVVEVGVVHTDKGAALQRLRQMVAASAVVFTGDDATDETVFARLNNGDVGVKVGDGRTLARYRVESVAAVAELFTHLATRRAPAPPTLD